MMPLGIDSRHPASWTDGQIPDTLNRPTNSPNHSTSTNCTYSKDCTDLNSSHRNTKDPLTSSPRSVWWFRGSDAGRYTHHTLGPADPSSHHRMVVLDYEYAAAGMRPGFGSLRRTSNRGSGRPRENSGDASMTYAAVDSKHAAMSSSGGCPSCRQQLQAAQIEEILHTELNAGASDRPSDLPCGSGARPIPSHQFRAHLPNADRALQVPTSRHGEISPITGAILPMAPLAPPLAMADGEDSAQGPAPERLHDLKHDSSVLAIAASDQYIFAGTHDGEILIWSLDSFQLITRMQAHKRSVLSLFLTPATDSTSPDTGSSENSPDNTSSPLQGQLLVSSAGDATISIWSPTTFQRLYEIYSTYDTGDIFSIAYSVQHQTVYIGAQDTTIQWVKVNDPRRLVAQDSAHHPDKRHHRFFDSKAVGGASTPRRNEERWGLIPKAQTVVEVHPSAIRQFAHFGYVYSMLMARGPAHTLGADEEVLMNWGYLWSASASGYAAKHSTVHYGNQTAPAETVSQKYQCLSRWKAHDGKILASTTTTYKNSRLYITGANDETISVWRVAECGLSSDTKAEEVEDVMIKNLRDFVSYKTISSRPEFAEDCHRGATFLCTLFKRLGGEVQMLQTRDKAHNPVVFVKFAGKLQPGETATEKKERKRILFYGHYDVVAADTKKGKWTSDPFAMKGVNGYLYGRGVSDNKGPIIAALYAVTDLLQEKSLESDVIFLIEGEEESGSRGFQETVREHHDLIGPIDYILLANSYWLDDETPCLTYGLRGVLHATIGVDSSYPDLHSGVEGSYMMSEPLSDLTMVLSKLKGPRNRVMIPNFYDSVLPLLPEEEARFDAITSMLVQRNPGNGPADVLKSNLMSRWREPNLTIHRYKVSGPDGSLVSCHACANISFRLVPGQEVDAIVASLEEFLADEFAQLESTNKLSIHVDNKAEPWLGDPHNYIFRTLEEAIIKAWAMDDETNAVSTEPEEEPEKVSEEEAALQDKKPAQATPKARRPLYIREGGSIPAIRFLEKQFGAPAAHLPCGQASDAAHLDNERLRVTNLLKSREIFKHVFQKL
ncbi:wd repeat-containing protein [Ophiostoma piceae UAMH 11346]|uniref:Wd repeat-containing protein n=1 Tax=Ophiostoma piceae (strain UAMH 11346) TaxID=1262450 RepID=S3C5G6_OPHP1|nr:wd repeat-containing protein [Ophiostoma piceae UAMH 11346]